MKGSAKKMMVLLAWTTSVVYLCGGESFGGFGDLPDSYRYLAIVGAVIATGSMILDRSFTRFFARISRSVRGGSPVSETP